MNPFYKITYVCNTGILAQYQGKKILIDGLCDSVTPIYKNPTDEAVHQIIKGISPFDDINMMLFTHHHTDHFEANSTAAALKNNPNIAIISTSKTISMLAPLVSNYDKEKMVALVPALHASEYVNIQGIDIRAISLTHDGKGHENVQNLAYLIQIEDKKILHVGDAKPFEENFKNLNLVQEEIDLLLAPFPYVGIPSGREVIKKYIAPKKIGAIHLPYQDKDEGGWIRSTKKSLDRVKDHFIEALFFEEIGTSIFI